MFLRLLRKGAGIFAKGDSCLWHLFEGDLGEKKNLWE